MREELKLQYKQCHETKQIKYISSTIETKRKDVDKQLHMAIKTIRRDKNFTFWKKQYKQRDKYI